MTLGEECRSTPGRIDMEMALKFSSQVSHCFKWVDITGFRGPGNTDQRQRPNVLILQALTGHA